MLEVHRLQFEVTLSFLISRGHLSTPLWMVATVPWAASFYPGPSWVAPCTAGLVGTGGHDATEKGLDAESSGVPPADSRMHISFLRLGALRKAGN